jgi:hypothetical protein
MHMIQGRGLTLKRAGGLAGLAGTLTLVGALVTSQAADAAGNPNFEGIVSAAPPTGFVSSPATYNLSNGSVTVDFNVVARNLTQSTQKVGLHFSADHILTYNGENVADGQPGQAGIAFSGPEGTTQALIAGEQSFTETWGENATETISLSYTFDACGYYQLDLWAPWKGNESRTHATLASGFVRILGCTGDSTPTPNPTDGVDGSTSSPTPTGAVLALTTPSTGAGGGLLTLGGLLVMVGGGLLVASTRGRKVNI